MKIKRPLNTAARLAVLRSMSKADLKKPSKAKADLTDPNYLKFRYPPNAGKYPGPSQAELDLQELEELLTALPIPGTSDEKETTN